MRNLRGKSVTPDAFKMVVKSFTPEIFTRERPSNLSHVTFLGGRKKRLALPEWHSEENTPGENA
jgi:hypothetical protein